MEDAKHRKPQQWQNQLQKLDHPVVFVSWDDVVAYAAWLTRRTGQTWRLPTEAEWEKAARWDASTGTTRLYPWGDKFEAARCNTVENGQDRTTSVGSYPIGASPYGAEEMAGNVWEWTHSLYKLYPYTGSDGREAGSSKDSRVMRGGSWYSTARNTRAAFRAEVRPGALNHSDGFRLLLAGAGSA